MTTETDHVLPVRELRTLAVSAHRLFAREARLDAAYYAGNWAELAVEASGLPCRLLGEIATVWYPGRFARNYRPTGTPFVGSREMLFWPVRPTKHLASTHAQTEALLVRPGDILVRRSGSVGAVAHVTADFDGIAVTEHALRVRPEPGWGGYLYAMLRSDIGQAMLKRNAFGAVVDEIEPEHLLSMPVPVAPDEDLAQIAVDMEAAAVLQQRGAAMIRQAEHALLDALRLPLAADLPLDYLPRGADRRLRPFTVPSGAISARLDGSYHRPEVRAVREALRSTSAAVERLAERVVVTVPGRFKRVYVEPGFGVPFLQGVHVPMVRPEGMKYLSKRENARQLRTHGLVAGQVLVTCSGTLGRVGLVSDAQHGWIASQHVARVTCGPYAHPGYVYAFLASGYGRTQIIGQTYGAVVDELTAEQLGQVDVPWPDLAEQARIGDPILEAFRLRDQSLELEARAIARFRQLLT